jgi:hypothetical protein
MNEDTSSWSHIHKNIATNGKLARRHIDFVPSSDFIPATTNTTQKIVVSKKDPLEEVNYTYCLHSNNNF